MKAGLSKTERLRKRKEYKLVFSKGARISGKYVAICIIEKLGESSRLGLSVSKRIGKAVTRNRIKRRLREIFRHHKRDFGSGADIVLIGKKGIETKKYREIEADLLNTLRSYNKLPDSPIN